MRVKVWMAGLVSLSVLGSAAELGRTQSTLVSQQRPFPVERPMRDLEQRPSRQEIAEPKAEAETSPKLDANHVIFNYVDHDIRDLIEFISETTKKNFIIDERVKGKVTILAKDPVTPEEAYHAFVSSLEILGYMIVPSPGGYLKILPVGDKLPPEQSGPTDNFVTRILPLKNASAVEIASVIKPFLSKKGNLSVYPPTNILIMTDSGSNISQVLNIVKQMDAEGPEEILEMIPLKNAQAKDVADKLQKLFIDQSSAAQGQARIRPPQPNAVKFEAEERPNISKITPDERTNSILILASKRSFPKIRDVIAKLDAPIVGPKGGVHVYALRNSEAAKIAEVLSALTSGAGTARPPLGAAVGQTPTAPGARPVTATGGVPAVAEFEGGIKVTADETSNSLLITATQKDYETLVQEVIQKLDIPRRQVYVEVVIMEMRVKNDRNAGVFGQVGEKFNGNGANPFTLFGSSLGGTPAGITAAINGAGAAGVLGQGEISIPLPTGNITIPAFGGIVTALQQDENVNVLSTPNLLTLDNEEAQIHVGSSVPFPSGTTLTTGGNTTFNVTREDVGITLKIKPQVNEGDMVKMQIKQEVSGVVPGQQAGVVTTLGPTTTKRKVETVVVAKDQQPIVIGGLIDDSLTTNTSKIPFLGDIPLLGNLFKSKKRIKEKTNIMVLLRPYIIRDTADYLKILHKNIEERNNFIETNFGSAERRVIRENMRSKDAAVLEAMPDIARHKHVYEEVSSPNRQGFEWREEAIRSAFEKDSSTDSSSSGDQESSKKKKKKNRQRI